MKNADNINNIAFIGGDLRQLRVINQMAKAGKTVKVFGIKPDEVHKIDSRVQFLSSPDEIYEEFKIVVLPLPYTADGENVNTPLYDEKIPVSEVIRKMPQDGLVLAARCDERIKTMAEIYNVQLVDYFEREELMVLNAIPTAEGAIQIAMEEALHTIHGSKCLVIGNGRIGKILAKMLHGIGAKTAVMARKRKDLAQIFSFGYEDVPIWELHKRIGEFDIIFNTVPYLMLDYEMLSEANKNCLIIDLASKPGGVDFEAAQRMGIKVIWALSLPGKVAPDTAGDIIKDTILNILEETEGIG